MAGSNFTAKAIWETNQWRKNKTQTKAMKSSILTRYNCLRKTKKVKQDDYPLTPCLDKYRLLRKHTDSEATKVRHSDLSWTAMTTGCAQVNQSPSLACSASYSLRLLKCLPSCKVPWRSVFDRLSCRIFSQDHTKWDPLTVPSRDSWCPPFFVYFYLLHNA